MTKRQPRRAFTDRDYGIIDAMFETVVLMSKSARR